MPLYHRHGLRSQCDLILLLPHPLPLYPRLFQIQDLSSSEKKNLRIENGVKISSLKSGKMSSVGIRNGFIITRLNNKSVSSAEDVDNIDNSSENNTIMIEGVYPQNPNSKYVYSFNIK